jgi:uncharacterized protein
MKIPRLYLSVQKVHLTICRLPPDLSIPGWASGKGAFTSITRTSEELSIVCPEGLAPKTSKQEPGWRLLKIEGPLDFSLTGILASLANPLAMAGISIFAMSTFDTDYLMVKEKKLDDAVQVLTAAGHQIEFE